jgi:hypothetical protein
MSVHNYLEVCDKMNTVASFLQKTIKKYSSPSKMKEIEETPISFPI